MNQRSAKSSLAALVAVCVAIPLAVAVFDVHQWLQVRKISRDLDALADNTPDDQVRDETDRQRSQRRQLTREVARLTDELKQAESRRMPLTADAAKDARLDLLNLAARCGVRVEEVSQLDNDPQAAARVLGDAAVASPSARRGSEAFLNRFSRGKTKRPLLRITATAGYPAIQQFLTQLDTLQWTVTPVLFDIGPGRNTTAADEWDPLPTTTSSRRNTDGRTLCLTLVVAF